MKQSSIAIVGLNALFREGLQVLLRRSRFVVVCSTANLAEADPLLESMRPDLLIHGMDGGSSGPVETRTLCQWRAERDWLRVVMLTGPLNADNLWEAASGGIRAVLSKDITSDVLQRSLELVMLGQQVFPGLPEQPPPRPTIGSLVPFVRTASHAGTDARPASQPIDGQGKSLARPVASIAGKRATVLSDREKQILRCLVDGAANKTIARDLQITEATVKVHIKGLLRKIRVNNRTQAAVWGLNNTGMFNSTDAAEVRFAAS